MGGREGKREKGNEGEKEVKGGRGEVRGTCVCVCVSMCVRGVFGGGEEEGGTGITSNDFRWFEVVAKQLLAVRQS